MTYNTAASLDKLSCSNHVDIVKKRDSFVLFLGSQMFPFTWMLISKFSGKVKTKTAEKYKILQGRGSFQPVFVIEESPGHCSGNLW